MPRAAPAPHGATAIDSPARQYSMSASASSARTRVSPRREAVRSPRISLARWKSPGEVKVVGEGEKPLVGLCGIGCQAQRELGQLGCAVRCAARTRALRRGVEHARCIGIRSAGRERDVTRSLLEVGDRLSEPAVHRAQLRLGRSSVDRGGEQWMGERDLTVGGNRDQARALRRGECIRVDGAAARPSERGRVEQRVARPRRQRRDAPGDEGAEVVRHRERRRAVGATAGEQPRDLERVERVAA